MTGGSTPEAAGEEMLQQMIGSLHQDFSHEEVSIQEAFASATLWRTAEDQAALADTLTAVLASHPTSAAFESLFLSRGAGDWTDGADLRNEAELFLRKLRLGLTATPS